MSDIYASKNRQVLKAWTAQRVPDHKSRICRARMAGAQIANFESALRQIETYLVLLRVGVVL